MTQMICLATRHGNEKGVGYQYIVKLNQNNGFAVASVKRVAVFQASLRVVREEAGAHRSKRDNNCSTSQGSEHLWEGGCCK